MILRIDNKTRTHKASLFFCLGDYEESLLLPRLRWTLKRFSTISVLVYVVLFVKTYIFTDPKQLPCLSDFCLQCLERRHETSHGRDTIKCPDCYAPSTVPDSGDLKDLLTSYYLNGLIDALSSVSFILRRFLRKKS